MNPHLRAQLRPMVVRSYLSKVQFGPTLEPLNAVVIARQTIVQIQADILTDVFYITESRTRL
jgi:hypothetical protein